MKFKVLFVGILLSSILFTFCQKTTTISFVEKTDQIDVMFGDKLFTSYVYKAELGKPILYPVYSPSGVFMTRHVPPVESDGETQDHQHHAGVYFTYEINKNDNFWAVKTAGTPRIEHVKVTDMKVENNVGVLSTVMNWIGKNGKTLLEENRTMTFYPGTNANEIEFSMTLTAKDTTVVFQDTKEGMFGVRVADWMREQDKQGTATYTSSNGDQNEKGVWGKRAKWMKLEGAKDGKTCGIAIFNHPESVNYPTYWHARGYGLFAANPLGQFMFQKGRKVEEPKPFNLTLNPGESALFQFKLIVYEGEKTSDEIEALFRQYAG